MRVLFLLAFEFLLIFNIWYSFFWWLNIKLINYDIFALILIYLFFFIVEAFFKINLIFIYQLKRIFHVFILLAISERWKYIVNILCLFSRSKIFIVILVINIWWHWYWEWTFIFKFIILKTKLFIFFIFYFVFFPLIFALKKFLCRFV